MSSRDAMIDGAIVLFRERGVAATSLRDVVEYAGAPRGSIYHHFPGGKAQLAEEATRRAGDFISAVLDRLTEDDDPERAVQRFVDYWTSALAASDFKDGCPVAAAAVSGQDTSSARDAAGRAFATWEESLADARRRRGVPHRRAESLGGLTLRAVEGAIIVARARRTNKPLEYVGRELRALLANL
jgi:TetR/AcrR family transcriptional repressor of lmrAB and yxaGH operons